MYNQQHKYITSPITNRLIIVGGRAWKKLKQRGLLNKDEKKENEKILYEIEDDINDDILDGKLETAKEIIQQNYDDENTEVVKGRGKYRKCIVKKLKKNYTEKKEDNLYDKIALISKKVYKENLDYLKELDEDDLEDEIRRLINDKINNDD